MAYEPDDFDNNPFADEVGISEDIESQPQPVEIPAIVNDSNETTPMVHVTDATTQSDDDLDLREPEEGYPTDDDLKMYLPERYNSSKFKLAVKVTEIESSGNQTSYNPTIKIASKVVGLKSFRKETYKEVRRTYRELEAFYKFLIYNNVEVFVPAFPPISSTYTSMSPEWIKCLQSSLQLWFNRICSIPLLVKNHEFSLLFEQPDFGYVPSKTKPAASSIIPTGIKRKTMKQFQPPPDSCEKLSKFRPLIKEIYLTSQKIVEKFERCLKLDRQTAFYVNEYVNELTIIGNLDPSNEMVRMWNRFQKIIAAFNESDLVNNVSYTSALIEFFQLISLDCYNIKEALTNRHLLLKELLNAEEITRKKHLTIDKLKMKSTIDPLKVDESIRALEISNKYEKELRYQVKRASFEMVIESDEVMHHFTQKLKQLLALITQQRIRQERKKLNLLINNRVINPKDSLAKLGREDQVDNVSTISTLNSPSGGTGGDSWSSRPRKSYSIKDDSNNSDDRKRSLNDEISRVDAKQAASLLSSATF